MQVVSTRDELISSLNSDSYNGSSIGFVPTMGALHQGHISLLEKAQAGNDKVVTSIFVNPKQFNDPADLEKYPRTLDKDLRMLEKSGCDLVFIPAPEEVYDGEEVMVPDPGKMAEYMEGASRPGHFKGVMMVVRRLFELVKPHNAYFGKKDFQQLAIIRFMVRDLGLPVHVIGCDTVRESDGLALSSRNVLLTGDERKHAPDIFRGLTQAAQIFRESGGAEARKQFTNSLESTGLFRVAYLEFADSKTLVPSETYNESILYRAFTAVACSRTRLIDNVAV